ncbi:hypothetical protein [Pseudoalteromonas sp. MTN2-4]|uniref:hypothetical protein n=1 Tax=Pseudoalteromonas sp. MTN2-4 TaxID=3056555 RepID=UPI0036F20B35
MFDGLINNLKIKTKISLLSVIPTFFVLINFIYLVLFQYLSYKESSRLEIYVNAVNVLDQTANNFAVERGLTAGYLASGGKKRDRVLAQRKNADLSKIQLFTLTDE